jgi:hypothetical protein
MAVRQWVETTEREGGQFVPRYRVTCSECGVTDSIGRQNMGPKIANEQVPKKFAVKGWHVGHSPNHDKCPSCAERARKKGSVHVLEVFEKGMERMKVVAAIKADPPREMSRDDRRIIFAKLNEVYIDEKNGYDKGWSDKKIGDDLNVPLAWVKTIREENFGPARTEEIDQVIVEARAVSQEIRDLNQKLTDLINAVKVASDRAARIERAAKDIEGAFK